MYDATSRQELREQIGYEGWLIQRCHDCLEKNKGIIAPLTVVIHDDGARDFHVVITDYIGAASAASLVNDMTPLIFCSSFKILDLVLEWCLRENGITPAQRAFSFSEKIRRCRTNAIKVWPDFIENSAALQTVITAMYAYCRPKRNAIVHDVWGTNVDGDLHFDYHYNDDVSGARSYPRVHDTDVVEQQAVLAFSEFSRVVQELLVDPAKQDEGQLTRLKRVCNRFQAMHGQPTFYVSEV
ncbi:MAG: hypothetical protein NTU88_12305, partial [Armatimonadetes bacterium]|nr:hypothetical protein [Armatimonadota bacterium]